ncbi:hypothetical protein ACWIDS_11090, partial [Dietzia maris]
TGGSEEGGSLDTESLTGGSEEGGSLDAGSLGDILGELTGSASGSGEGAGSDFGSGDVTVPGSGAGSDAGTILALGSLAGAGIGIGLIVSGGVNLPGSALPPLPEINVGLVCNLPPEAIDFLKDNGSMEQDECEPEEEQN